MHRGNIYVFIEKLAYMYLLSKNRHLLSETFQSQAINYCFTLIFQYNSMIIKLCITLMEEKMTTSRTCRYSLSFHSEKLTFDTKPITSLL